MADPSPPPPPRWWATILPICSICFLYLCSFFLFVCATNSLVYSTVCLLRANASFCAQIDQNQSFIHFQEEIQKESSQWSLYGTLAFAIVASIMSPIYGSLSDTKNRKLPIVLTICNAIVTGLIIIVGSVYQGTQLCLILYIVANVVNGFGGGALILISYVDRCGVSEESFERVLLLGLALDTRRTRVRLKNSTCRRSRRLKLH